MKRVLCFGDSNTWGYISGTDHQRYGIDERWTRVLGKLLGSDYEIIEEGLNSRTLFTIDERPGKEGRQGFGYLKPCLDTHDKIDIMVLFLGTNELKDTFCNTAEVIVSMIDKFIDFILNFSSQIDGSKIKLIVCGIPPVAEGDDLSKGNGNYKYAVKKSEDVINLCKKYFDDKRIYYVENNDLTVGVDCVHLTLDSHQKLASKLFNVIKNI